MQISCVQHFQQNGFVIILYQKHKKKHLAGQAFRNTSYILLILIFLEIRANDRSGGNIFFQKCLFMTVENFAWPYINITQSS